ncbi:cation:proton antiporter [Piscinibacter sp.]|uniref:cation:proton antiporter n=1 Tax=Piscinibacter sp. TaxID=1903157 RepID=UPI002C6BA7D6|nr:cation:proton antiporter [Albitalea sp.]HUG22669.1 cation:proton antiporter [Albitalea sp.]
MTELTSFAAPASAPLWTLEGFRGADPVLGLAFLMLMAVVLADLLHRYTRLPRAAGHILTGALASPLVLRLIERNDLDTWKPLVDLAIAVLVFELGTRIRPRWLIDNPALAVTCLLEGLLAGLAVTGALLLLGAPLLSASIAGTVAMSTSPAITLVVLHDLRPRGQVTERLLLMTAVNSVLAILLLKVLNVIGESAARDIVTTATGALYVISGSFLLGTACGLLLVFLSGRMRGTSATPVLQIGLVIIASMLAAQWTLSPLLALLVAGIVARARMRHGLTVEPQLGSAGAALSVVLFIFLGLLLTLDNFGTVWPWVLAIIVARALGKGAAVALLARASGLGWRQAAALTLALQPMTSLAVLLAADTFAWGSQLPGMALPVLHALLAASTLMQLTGPLWTTLALQRVAGETSGETAA